MLAFSFLMRFTASSRRRPMATMCQTRKATPAEIEMYGDIMHDHFAQITAK